MRVAILQIRRMPDHYFFDTLNVTYAGDLRRDGHDARVLECNLAGAAEEAEALAPLRRRLADDGVELLLLDRVHRPDLVADLRPATARAVGLLHQGSGLRLPGVDFVLPHMDRQPVRAVAAALAAGRTVDGLAGVKTPAGEAPLGAAPGVERLFDGADLAYDLLEVVRAPPVAPPLRKHVFGNLGCPYRNAPNRTGFLDGISVPDGVTTRGCTFCDRPDYERIRPPRALDLLADQIGQVRGHFPSLEQLVLVDEYALRYVDDFVALALERGLDGVEIFFSARIDYILKFRKRFESAVARAGDRLRLVMYLVGIENFSPFELWRFNKGVGLKRVVEALGILEDLKGRAPQFRVEPSFGFILFTPWTTPLDLYLNLLYLRRLDFHRWRQAAALTRLRLYAENALFYKAAADGLLREGAATGADASDRYGYEAEVPWRFADPRVDAIYQAVFTAGDGAAGLAALERALRPFLKEIRENLRDLDLEDPATLAAGARTPGPVAAPAATR